VGYGATSVASPPLPPEALLFFQIPETFAARKTIMKHLISVFLMLVGVATLHGCGKGSHVAASLQMSTSGIVKPHESSSETFAITGTVKYVTIEGGFFAIVGDDGRKYDPVNLPDDLKKDGLKVQGTARLKEDAISIHMYGPIIEIVNITARQADTPCIKQ